MVTTSPPSYGVTAVELSTGWRSWGPWVALFAAALVVYLAALGNAPITDAESKYAEAPREMLVLRDWLTPHYDYVRYLSKPPLAFWIGAAVYGALGVNEFTARLPGTLAGIAVGALIGAFGSYLFGRRAGWLAAFTWLTTALVFIFSRDTGLEFWLVLFMGLAMYGFVRGLEERRWLYAGYLGMALGFLLKGPMGILWPLASVLLWLGFCGQWSRRRSLWHARAFVLFALLALPWPVVMALRHDDFLWYTLVHEQLYRVLGKRTPNEALFPTSTFLLMTVGHFFPWILHLPQALLAAARRLRAGRAPGLVLALVWSGFPLLFFSLARSKGDYYALQIFPGWCLLVAWLWEAALERRQALLWLALPWLVTAALALAVLAAGALGLWSLPPSPEDFAERFVPVAAVGGVAVGTALLLGRRRLALAGVAVYMTVFFALFQRVFEARALDESMHFAAVAYRAEAPPGAHIVSDERSEFAHVCSLNFYLDEPAWLVRDAENSRLHFSFKEYEKRVVDEADLADWVRAGIPVYAVGELDRWPARFERLGLRSALRARQGERGLYRLGLAEDRR
jgi:4-amino-4-deoxy-L-arabinose transferase-like glycosyltransferase